MFQWAGASDLTAGWSSGRQGLPFPLGLDLLGYRWAAVSDRRVVLLELGWDLGCLLVVVR